MGLFGSDYDQVKVGGDFQALPAGGYVMCIKNAKITNSSNGLPMIVAIADIAEGEYKGYFHKLYRERVEKDINSKYPYNGTFRIVAIDAEGKTKKNFKAFCTAVEDSNDIQLPRNNDEAFLKALVGRMVGVLYQREEYEGNDGKNHWSTKPKWFRNVETIREGKFTVPEDRPLSDTDGTGFSGVSASVGSFDSVGSFGNPTASFDAPQDTATITDMFGVTPSFDSEADSFNAAEDDIPF